MSTDSFRGATVPAAIGPEVAPPDGLEPPTGELEARCSIHLSYGGAAESYPAAHRARTPA
jgi:hypothetical protein